MTNIFSRTIVLAAVLLSVCPFATLAAEEELTIIDRGPNHRTWRRSVAAVSTNGFATAEPRHFQINPAPSNAQIASYNFKEYIGLTFRHGFLYPAWLDNSVTTTNGWEIFSARIPF